MPDIEEKPVIEETPIEDIKEEASEELELEEVEKKEEVEEPIDIEKVEVETRRTDEEAVKYDEEIDPDDVKTIGAVVKKETEGLRKQLQDTQDQLEIDTFIREKPEFEKYKPAILKYLQHPAYSKIPVKNIASMIASNDLIKMGAKKERDAQEKVAATKDGGSQVRKPQVGATDWTKAPKPEFEAQKLKVLRHEV